MREAGLRATAGGLDASGSCGNRALEGEVESQLDFARGSIGSTNLAEVRVAERRVRIRVVRRIGEVEEVGLEPDGHRVVQRSGLG